MIAILIACEIISVPVIIYAFMHKEDLLQFEDKVRRVIREIKIGLCIKFLKNEGFVVKKSEVE